MPLEQLPEGVGIAVDVQPEQVGVGAAAVLAAAPGTAIATGSVILFGLIVGRGCQPVSGPPLSGPALRGPALGVPAALGTDPGLIGRGVVSGRLAPRG